MSACKRILQRLNNRHKVLSTKASSTDTATINISHTEQPFSVIRLYVASVEDRIAVCDGLSELVGDL